MTEKYKPLEDYGLIGDLHTVAMVDKDGSIDFMCVPDFDSPTVFGVLLDHDDGGIFELGPVSDDYRFRQMYVPDTNVLVTRFLSLEGVGEVVDFMPVGAVRHATAIVRRVKCVRGPFTFRLNCAPRFDYARMKHRAEQEQGSVVFRPEDEKVPAMRLHVPIEVGVEGGDAVAEFTLRSGESLDFVLEVVRPGVASPAADPGWVERAYYHTVEHWRDWLCRSPYHGRWQQMVDRSALTLKLMSSQRYGSIVAAPTFGLPELVGGERNWDYRYTWIRDGSLTAATLIRLGFTEEPKAFLRWIAARFAEAGDSGRLQIMYGIDGRRELTEETLGHLDGYRFSSPVRVGNGAYDQLQLDIYGELMLMIDAFDEKVEPVSYDLWRHVRTSIEWVANNWHRADEGIWEVRGGRQQFLFSRLMCWVAVDRALRIAARRSLPAPMEHWRQLRDEIHQDIYYDFWDDERGAFVQHKGTTTLDASCLLMPIVGFIASRDPRWLSTLQRVEDELVDDSLVYRYRTGDAADDGLSGDEGTFCMCSYWYVECLARAGEVDRARLYLDKIHTYANHLGLFAEEMDATGRYLGNFPQAFTHLGLINAVLTLEEVMATGRTSRASLGAIRDAS